MSRDGDFIMTNSATLVMQSGIALVRRPGPRLTEGIVTHIDRVPVETYLGAAQVVDIRGQAIADPRLTPGIAWPQHLAPFGEDKRLDEVFSATAAYTP